MLLPFFRTSNFNCVYFFRISDLYLAAEQQKLSWQNKLRHMERLAQDSTNMQLRSLQRHWSLYRELWLRTLE
ncbi:hypothetical protein AB205_0115440 [Aquarana catesbeiana]|uniref:Uncharacterized protein n=1 Tax=Aquarana catesbeiana TaxID=8400 RepID=A0A2G9R672_AQUCT|nr:hypothetical protein AB205_0115440 [Aquarana catesbeiana]